jgi:hypothetical protein
MDISTAGMLLVQKITSLAWNISDYKYLKEEENKKTENSSSKAKFVLSPYLRKCVLEKVPSFFYYMAYVLFPINSNVGMIFFYFLIFFRSNC